MLKYFTERLLLETYTRMQYVILRIGNNEPAVFVPHNQHTKVYRDNLILLDGS